MTVEELRRLALTLPEVAEQDHHGMPSFRIRGKIIATVPDEGRVRVFLPSEYVDLALEHAPSACDEVWWGKKRLGVSFQLAKAPRSLLKEMLEQAWRHKAPKTLVKMFDAQS